METAQAQAMKEILLQKKKVEFEFLAIQIFLTRTVREIKENPSMLSQNIEKFGSLLEKNKSIPAVQRDIDRIVA